ncbi:MAG: nucleotidyltransferase domain-containing protein [Verrucomicrobia bacterium]|nr:nucleotidyltransferase domain-containing protein [Verrucomicrobiota bacterium]
MSLAELKEILAGPCSRRPVKSLKVFGSVARGESSAGSDLDLLVQFEEMPPAEYANHYFGLLHELQDAVGSKVDLLTPGSVTRPSLQRNILEQGISVYEA